MSVYTVDPLRDPRWPGLIRSHPRASVFHTSGWLEALQRTYGYEPVAFTTSPPRSELKNGVVFCYVRSAITGARLVSLPFSDHCDPLVDGPQELATLCDPLLEQRRARGWSYIELRPR